jgi:hypothetical protein
MTREEQNPWEIFSEIFTQLENGRSDGNLLETPFIGARC